MLDFVLNFLFPPVCGICGKINKNWICDKCKKRIKRYEKFQYIKMNYRDSFTNKTQGFVNQKIYYDEFLYCFDYKNLIRKLLLDYKFFDKSYLSNFWAKVIMNNKKVDEIFKIYDIIIPVPIDKTRKKERGYNQTELITNIFFKEKNILSENKAVIKFKETKTQSLLNFEERKENIKNAYKIINIEKIKNKNVILFDDIYTTGATVNEISKMLKNSGVNKILVLVIAKD